MGGRALLWAGLCMTLTDFWLLSVAVPGQVLHGTEGTVQRSSTVQQDKGNKKKRKLVTVFVSSICTNVFKYKTSLSGKDPLFSRLLCNNGKQKRNSLISLH